MAQIRGKLVEIIIIIIIIIIILIIKIIGKYDMLVMKSGKRHITEGVERTNQVVIRTLGEKETNKYLRIFEADTIKQQEMKEKTKKEYLRSVRKLFETKLYCWNLVKRINPWAVSHVRYSEPFLKWTRVELKQVDQRTKKK